MNETQAAELIATLTRLAESVESLDRAYRIEHDLYKTV